MVKNLNSFSVLLSVYKKNCSRELLQVLNNISQNTVLPNQIVLVIDGPLTFDIATVCSKWLNPNQIQLRVVKRKSNGGLARALNEGLTYVTNDLVARCDVDDVNSLDRFEKQLKYMTSHDEVDILGGQVQEISTNGLFLSERHVPTQHQDIVSFAKFRSPMNHPTVMFRKNAISKIGAYRSSSKVEDYDLWVRAIMQHLVLHNLPDVLVNMTVEIDTYKRRSGFKYYLSYRSTKIEQYKIGFINLCNLMSSCFLMFCSALLLPTFVRRYLYTKFLRREAR